MKLGRLPARPEAEAPRLKLAQFLRPAAEQVPPLPATVDWTSRVTDWPVYLNQEIGDCTVAAAAHMIEAWWAYGQGHTVKVTDRDVLTAYEVVSGYVPGDPSTDQGAVMQDVLNYWRKTGIGGHKILAFAEVNIRKPAEVYAALAIFGHVYVGINCPQSALAQFDQRKPWDVVPDDGGDAGGHAIDLGAEDAGRTGMKVVTWGRVQPLTSAFFDRYAEEAWVVCDESWVDAGGLNPAGLDVAALNAAFTDLTGQSAPFPVPTPPPPAPTPVPPAPSPSPAPQVDDADRYLAGAVTDWAHARHSGPGSRVAQAMRAWLKAKGL